jgi:hypothetical protein
VATDVCKDLSKLLENEVPCGEIRTHLGLQAQLANGLAVESRLLGSAGTSKLNLQQMTVSKRGRD